MKIVIKYEGPMTIEEFADKHDLRMEIEYNYRTNQYVASFEKCDIIDNGTLRSAFGFGESHEIAIQNHALLISGKKIVLCAGNHLQERRLQVPLLITERIPEPEKSSETNSFVFYTDIIKLVHDIQTKNVSIEGKCSAIIKDDKCIIFHPSGKLFFMKNSNTSLLQLLKMLGVIAEET